jgi:hypothetical protein
MDNKEELDVLFERKKHKMNGEKVNLYKFVAKVGVVGLAVSALVGMTGYTINIFNGKPQSTRVDVLKSLAGDPDQSKVAAIVYACSPDSHWDAPPAVQSKICTDVKNDLKGDSISVPSLPTTSVATEPLETPIKDPGAEAEIKQYDHITRKKHTHYLSALSHIPALSDSAPIPGGGY